MPAPPAATLPAAAPNLPAFIDIPGVNIPGVNIPGINGLFDDDPGDLPLSMALLIAVAGLATVALVLRGTFGRSPHLPVVDETASLKFH
ncbi:MAG: hypothetical protein WEA75_01975 [Acidimicrobiia bacterium]